MFAFEAPDSAVGQSSTGATVGAEICVSCPVTGRATVGARLRVRIALLTTTVGVASGSLLPPSPPTKQANSGQDQAGKASTCDGAGRGSRRRQRKTGRLTTNKGSTKWAKPLHL